MRRWIWWTAGLLLLAVVVLVLKRPSALPTRISEEQYRRILDEITSVEFAVGSLTPDHGGSLLAYVRATESGRGLSFLDLKTLERFSVRLTNEVTQVCGWSPDDRYLAFVQTLAPGVARSNQFGLRESWLTLYDRRSNSVRRLTEASGVFEPYFYWLTTNRYLYVSRWLTNDYAEFYLGSLDSSERKKVSNYRPELVVMSESLAAHLERGQIASLQLKPLQDTDTGTNRGSRAIEVLSDFKEGQFDQFKWLRYSRETGKFLFCARPATSSWRYLFEFDPRTRGLRQLSHEDTYNGQWLEGGSGYAYVVNTNNGFHLAVRPQDTRLHTNLFASGGVVNYTVAPGGNLIYITAALGAEPHAIWEYDVRSRGLRSLWGNPGRTFSASRLLRPQEFKVRSFDGVEIPCFLFSPAKSTEQGPEEATARPGRHPAVVYVPPTSSQFQKSFDERSQLLANLGFYFLAVNYRGCDGYGREYSALANTAHAARDVLAARNHLVAHHPVDPKRIFLCTISGGSDVVFELLATGPGQWQAVALDKPSGTPIDPRLAPGRLPPMLLITGDADPAFPAVCRYADWARSNGAECKLVVHTNSSHFTFKVDERKDKLDRVARFFLEHLR